MADHAEIPIVPNRRSGNMPAKEPTFVASAASGGLVVGARAPVVLAGRADDERSRLVSAALARLYEDLRRAAAIGGRRRRDRGGIGDAIRSREGNATSEAGGRRMHSGPTPSRTAKVSAVLLLGAALMTMHAEPAVAQAGHFQLTSPAFSDNALLSKKSAGRNPANPNCVGENVSPSLQWSNPPAGTRSYAIIMHDQEGRNGLGVTHWLAYGIDAAVTSLPEGAGDGTFRGITGGRNILGQGTYFGPCPPKTHGPHHYVFTIIATDLEPTALEPGLTMPQLLEAIGSHARGAAGLVGRFGH